MGSKGSQTTTQNQVQTYAPNPAIGAAGTQALTAAQQASQAPFQQPVAPVAPFNPYQLLGFGETLGAQGMAQPYFGLGSGYLMGSAAPVSGQDVANYYNPMAANVTAQMQNIFGQQMREATGQATQLAGGVGADRIGVAQANLANQQGLAAGQTYSQLYQQALQAAEQQKQMMAGAGYGLGQMGPAAQAAQLQAIQALLGVGGQGQQLTQAQLNALYQNELARIAYPFQTAQYLAGITGGLAPAMGGTTTGQATTTTPAPSALAQILGIGTAGLGLYGGLGGTFSNPFAGGAAGSTPTNLSFDTSGLGGGGTYAYGNRGGRMYADGGSTYGKLADAYYRKELGNVIPAAEAGNPIAEEVYGDIGGSLPTFAEGGDVIPFPKTGPNDYVIWDERLSDPVAKAIARQKLNPDYAQQAATRATLSRVLGGTGNISPFRPPDFRSPSGSGGDRTPLFADGGTPSFGAKGSNIPSPAQMTQPAMPFSGTAAMPFQASPTATGVLGGAAPTQAASVAPPFGGFQPMPNAPSQQPPASLPSPQQLMQDRQQFMQNIRMRLEKANPRYAQIFQELDQSPIWKEIQHRQNQQFGGVKGSQMQSGGGIGFKDFLSPIITGDWKGPFSTIGALEGKGPFSTQGLMNLLNPKQQPSSSQGQPAGSNLPDILVRTSGLQSGGAADDTPPPFPGASIPKGPNPIPYVPMQGGPMHDTSLHFSMPSQQQSGGGDGMSKAIGMAMQFLPMMMAARGGGVSPFDVGQTFQTGGDAEVIDATDLPPIEYTPRTQAQLASDRLADDTALGFASPPPAQTSPLATPAAYTPPMRSPIPSQRGPNVDMVAGRYMLPAQDRPYSDALQRDWGQDLTRSPWMALVKAGAAMAQTRGPIGSVIGAGLGAGAGELEGQRKELRNEQDINLKAQALFQRAQEHLDSYQRIPAGQQAELALKQQQFDRQMKQLELEGLKPFKIGQDPTTMMDIYGVRDARTGQIIPINPQTGRPTNEPGQALPVQPTTEIKPQTPAPLGVEEFKPNLNPTKSTAIAPAKGPFATAEAGNIRNIDQQMNKERGALDVQHDQINRLKMDYATVMKDSDKDGFFTRMATMPGADPDTRVNAMRTANLVATSAGKPPVFNPEKVAAMEEAIKIQKTMGMSFAATISPRDAMQMQLASISAQPGFTQSPQGMQRLIGLYDGLVNHNEARHDFWGRWKQTNPRTSTGWEEDFRTKNPVDTYTTRALIENMPNQRAKEVLPQAVEHLRQHRNDPNEVAKFDRIFNNTSSYFLNGRLDPYSALR